LTEAGKQRLIELEGLNCKAYLDSAGLATIGVGHLLTKDELSSGKIQIGGQSIDYSAGLTRDQAVLLMEADLSPCVRMVALAVTVSLTANQRDALCIFAYNVGVTAFDNSTLLKKLNAGHYAAVPDELRRWIYAGGKVIDGLKHRREAEIRLWDQTET
jgi:lysozyme